MPLYDNQGSVLRIVDANGAVADSYTYDPYGVQTTNTNNYPQPFGYTGAYTNPNTGLIHLGARYYDLTLGRFTSPDPQTHPGDINQSSPYTYAGDDPINHTDPTGKSFFGDIGASFTATVGAVASGFGAVATGVDAAAGFAEGTVAGAALGVAGTATAGFFALTGVGLLVGAAALGTAALSE